MPHMPTLTSTLALLLLLTAAAATVRAAPTEPAPSAATATEQEEPITGYVAQQEADTFTYPSVEVDVLTQDSTMDTSFTESRGEPMTHTEEPLPEAVLQELERERETSDLELAATEQPTADVQQQQQLNKTKAQLKPPMPKAVNGSLVAAALNATAAKANATIAPKAAVDKALWGKQPHLVNDEQQGDLEMDQSENRLQLELQPLDGTTTMAGDTHDLYDTTHRGILRNDDEVDATTVASVTETTAETLIYTATGPPSTSQESTMRSQASETSTLPQSDSYTDASFELTHLAEPVENTTHAVLPAEEPTTRAELTLLAESTTPTMATTTASSREPTTYMTESNEEATTTGQPQWQETGKLTTNSPVTETMWTTDAVMVSKPNEAVENLVEGLAMLPSMMHTSYKKPKLRETTTTESFITTTMEDDETDELNVIYNEEFTTQRLSPISWGESRVIMELPEAQRGIELSVDESKMEQISTTGMPQTTSVATEEPNTTARPEPQMLPMYPSKVDIEEQINEEPTTAATTEAPATSSLAELVTSSSTSQSSVPTATQQPSTTTTEAPSTTSTPEPITTSSSPATPAPTPTPTPTPLQSTTQSFVPTATQHIVEKPLVMHLGLASSAPLTTTITTEAAITTSTEQVATTAAAAAPAPRALHKPVPHIERIFNSDGVEVLHGYSSVVRSNHN